MITTPPTHATMIAYDGMGCVILGAPGIGKSRLAQDAIMGGAKLVADDQVTFSLQSGLVVGAPPPPLAGMLEMRGIGIVRISDALPRSLVHLIIELDASVTDHLPEQQRMELLGVSLPYLRIAPPPKTSAAGLLLYLRALRLGGVMPTDWKPAV